MTDFIDDLNLDDELEPVEYGPEDRELSPFSLELDEWDQRKGVELNDESERLSSLGVSDETVADFHGCCFLQDVPLLSQDEVNDRGRHQFIQTMLESPDYQQLHELTQLDELSSSIATVHFAEKYAEHKKKEEEKTPEQRKDELRQQMDLLKAISTATEKASEEVKECKDAQAAFGMGPGSGGTNDPKRIAQLFKRVRQSKSLRRICELAGRYRRMAQSKQRQKTSHGFDDMVGVVQDGDVARILPHELAMLDDPLFSNDAYRRLVERQMMCREYQGEEPVGKGPIIAVVDECLHPDTLIPFVDGRLVKISEVVAGDEIFSVDFNTMKIVRQKVGRVAKVASDKLLYKINCGSGSITCSGTHRFFLMGEDGLVYEKRAEDLCVGDVVASPNKIPVNPTVATNISSEWAEVLGAMAGDGGVYNTPNSKQACLFEETVEHLEYHAKLWTHCGYKPLIRKQGGKNKLTVNNAKLVGELKTGGLSSLFDKQPLRMIPYDVLVLDNDLMAAFMRGLFDAEGNVGNHQIFFTVSSETLLIQVRSILKRFGIASGCDTQYSQIGDKRYPRLIISGHQSLKLFQEKIGFSMGRKKAKLAKIVASTKNTEGRSKYSYVPMSKVSFADRAKEIGIIKVPFANEQKNQTAWMKMAVAHVSRCADDIRANGISSNCIVLSRMATFLGTTLKVFRRAVANESSSSRKLIDSRLHLAIKALDELAAQGRTIIESDVDWLAVKSVELVNSDTDSLYDLTMDGEFANYMTSDFVVHNSGSMHGEKVHQAKALALALAWIARKQNRWCALVAFSGDSGERILTLQPGKWDELMLAHWLSEFIGRGSNLDLPLKELPQYYKDMGCPVGKVDIIMVTDGVVQLSDDIRQRFLKWKEEVQAKVISIIIGTYAGPLAQISDQVHDYANLDVCGDAVGAALSI